ncbi:PadR family transcriptional regulator [Dyadobacter pollutisoli]|uniref:Helix-turn-helix transcriptional regulator n=1 Tax=Dyadobacter pollutisoli TaxID=2910158 RepID=A0A9E8SNW2_9BACT|nr:helix-turn-helix transcriptional regulator [Dyadobacter pollutisoli]WAC14789.1 helix-turn-helix transcriptional regulator [Dyadobacter pollutisoli]
MNRAYLGEFEEIVLLTVAALDGNAYGVVLTHEIAEQTGRSVRLNQIHSALQRLEEKGMVKSDMGEPTAERGGRRKRLYSVTAYGQRTLQQVREVRENLWSRLVKPFNLAIDL